jgi:membrane protein implicated in regulation of membrane protease activity
MPGAMMDIIQFWHWWVVAAALGALDMLAQSGFFLWLGVAALVVGLMVFAFPALPLSTQLLAFAVLSVAAVVAMRTVLKRTEQVSALPNLNRRGQQYIGQLLFLESPIVNGRGRVRVGDTLWSVEGPDLPEGSRVRVISSDGTLLLVEHADRFE